MLSRPGLPLSDTDLNPTRRHHHHLHHLHHRDQMASSRADVIKDVIKDKPIGNGLDKFRSSYATTCEERGVGWSLAIVDQLLKEGQCHPPSPRHDASTNGSPEIESLTDGLLVAMGALPAVLLLPSASRAKNLKVDLMRLNLDVADSSNFDFARTKPLLLAALSGDQPDDALIWDRAYKAVLETTPPPRALPTRDEQTPRSRNTDGCPNSNEFRHHVDPVLKAELKCLYANIPNFFDTFFGSVPRLEDLSDVVFRRCSQGDDALFGPQGWTAWPPAASERDVLAWLADLIPRLESFMPNNDYVPRRKMFSLPTLALDGSKRNRTLDVGFIDSHRHGRGDWSHILIPGELKSNPAEDTAASAWLDVARYAREVFAAQDTRRFVLGFSLCGSLLRVWNFDRLGGIASENFNINVDDGGRHLVTMILGFLYMDEDRLGYDATIVSSPEGRRHLDIERDGHRERLVIDSVMYRSSCIVGRATTCWKVHREGDGAPLVVKDSWQYTDREEEGLLLQEAATRGVANIATYYHHETVAAFGAVDQIRTNIRNGINLGTGTAHRLDDSFEPVGRKRRSDSPDSFRSPKKRKSSTSPIKMQPVRPRPDRVHRRVVVSDYGKPVYKASTRAALLNAFCCCVRGHQSLHQAGILHRDVSIHNLIINEENQDPSSRGFLIDLDMAIRTRRLQASGAETMTGTRAFMAVGALLGRQHSFIYDIESFFWVLFWLCAHYDGPEKPARVVASFDKWNYSDANELADTKKGIVVQEEEFLTRMERDFTPYYAPLAPWVNRLRRVLFPGGVALRAGEGNEGIYDQVIQVLTDAQDDARI